MKFCPGQIDKIAEFIVNEELPRHDTILIGDNAVGKSEAIKQIVKKLLKKESVYFIDAVNRFFKVGKINDIGEKLKYSPLITKARIEDGNFNLVDTWSYYGTNTESIEIIYPFFEERIQKMMKEFFGTTFSIVLKETQEVRYDSGEVGKLSNGYQAILRLFLELLYCNETIPTSGEKKVVIDEIDQYLSPKTTGRLFPLLKHWFPELTFIVTTHSADFIAAARDCNIIIMQQNNYEVLDSNDFNSLDDVYGIFKEVFGYSGKKTEIKELEEVLRRLLNNKIAGIWEKDDEQQLAAIKEDDLSKAQKIIYRQIKEW